MDIVIGINVIFTAECTDTANDEQSTICIRWVDESMPVHEDSSGLYEVPWVDADALVQSINQKLFSADKGPSLNVMAIATMTFLM